MKRDLDLSQIDLRTLRYLKVLVDERHVSRAAALLGISQPSLSSALAKLRQIFGDPLFVRTPNGMDPTACANELAKLYVDVSAQMDLIQSATTSFDAPTSMRNFRVQANDYAIQAAVGRVIELVRQQAPGISITVDYVPDMDFRARLESGEVDLNVGYLPDIDETLHRFSFKAVEVCCIASKSHPNIHGELSLEAYVNAPHLCLSLGRGDLGSFMDRSIDNKLSALGLVRTKAAQVPTWLTMPAMVAKTDLIATVPREIATSAAITLPLQILPLPLSNFGLNLSVVWHDRADKDPASRWLRGLFRNLSKTSEAD